jgi:hypothetical protein
MNDKFKDKRPVKLEKTMEKGHIPLFGGRPARTRWIGKDDSLDLTILLNTTLTVDEFLLKI